MAKKNTWIVGTYAELAEFFGVSRDTIRSEWTVWMPGKPGRWDIREIVKARHDRVQQRVGPNDTLEYREVSKRERVAEMLTAEHMERITRLKADQAEGKLLPAEDVQRQIVEWCVRIRTPLSALADRVANIVPGEMKGTIKKLVNSQVQLVLKEAFDTGPLGHEVDDSEESEDSDAIDG